jgi:proline-specific peptidase
MSAEGFTTGEIDFIVPTTKQATKTWYKLYGDLATRNRRPLVVLHGGPGVVHDYMLSLADLWTKTKIPIIFYDQIGGGMSTHLPEKNGDHDFWSVQLFIAEFNNLLRHFKIDDDFDLLGNSWGAMLAAEFATTKPKGLKNLILASGPASMELFSASQKEKLAKFPQEIQDTLRKHEEAGTTDDPEYKNAMMPFLFEHVCRLKPPPPEFMACLSWLEKDPTVYYTMYVPFPCENKVVTDIYAEKERALRIPYNRVSQNLVNPRPNPRNHVQDIVDKRKVRRSRRQLPSALLR